MKVVEKCQCTEKCSGSCGSQRCSIYIYLFTEVHVIINEVHGCMFGQLRFTGASIFDRRCSRVHVWSIMVPGRVFG